MANERDVEGSHENGTWFPQEKSKIQQIIMRCYYSLCGRNLDR